MPLPLQPQPGDPAELDEPTGAAPATDHDLSTPVPAGPPSEAGATYGAAANGPAVADPSAPDYSLRPRLADLAREIDGEADRPG